MRRVPPFVFIAFLTSFVLFPPPAWSQEPAEPQVAADVVPAQVSLVAAVNAAADTPLEQTAPPPRAVEYSDAYRLRAKIHKISSLAMVPLFVTEGILGQSLYEEPSSGKRSAHAGVAAGIGGLFAVDTVTGVWNLVEGRKDPAASKRRWVHGLLMLGADAGFVATAALAPETERGIVNGSRSTHRAVAFASIGSATAGYLVMLLGGGH